MWNLPTYQSGSRLQEWYRVTTRTSQTRLLLTMNPCAVSHRAQLGRRNETHTRTRGPKVTATANLPGLIPISRNAQQRGGKPCLSLGLERKWKEGHKSSFVPHCRPHRRCQQSHNRAGPGAAATKIPLLPPVRFSKPTTQKPRPDNCRGGAAGRTCLVTII